MMNRSIKLSSRLGLGALAILVIAAVAAFAYFTSSGSAAASAKAGTLSAPTISSTSSGAGTASLSWSAVTPPAAGGVTYTVTRGGTAVSRCTNITTTSCTDSGLSKGTYTYAV